MVVSQLHRSPGICFEQTLHANGSMLYSFRIIPDRGSWIEVQFDTSDLIWIYMDRRAAAASSWRPTFLRALGYGTDEELLGLFYTFETLDLTQAARARSARQPGASRTTSSTSTPRRSWPASTSR